MQSLDRVLALRMLVILTGLIGGCSSGAHSTASRQSGPDHSTASKLADEKDQIYLAQAAACWNSMSCCIQNHPLTPVESCGADPVEVAKILKTLEELAKAAQTATLKGVDDPERGEERGDGEERPDWREYCINQYSRCIELKWTGNCSSCLERCKGQRGVWPDNMCSAPMPRRKR